jgi:L-lactate permease
LCLIANTAPVAFGALGIPILVAGASFAACQFFTSNFWAYELPDISSALFSLVCLALFLKVWHPAHAFSFQSVGAQAAAVAAHRGSYNLGQVFKAWSPFIVLTIMVTIWTLPAFKDLFDAMKNGPLSAFTLSWHIPGLDNLVIKDVPIVGKPTPYSAVYKFDILAATGTSILVSAIVSAFILGVGVKMFFQTFWETLAELVKPVFTIGLVLGFASSPTTRACPPPSVWRSPRLARCSPSSRRSWAGSASS